MNNKEIHQALTKGINPSSPVALVINSGSSSIKFALFGADHRLERIASGHLDRTNKSDPRAIITKLSGQLKTMIGDHQLLAIGHRIVHGGQHRSEPTLLTPSILNEINRLRFFMPEHLPTQIRLVKELQHRFPAVPQIACFDTAFHRTMPDRSKRLALPRQLTRWGIERYGFHGISCAYLMRELARAEKRRDVKANVIVAHLGNGCSLTAVKNGKSIDTTMSFTPASGVPMSTRSGDLDPGLVSYLIKVKRFTLRQFHNMVNEKSGLLGISETSSDLRDLLRRRRSDRRAGEAIDHFCYQIAKAIGALTISLGGLGTLVFSGGIGENSPDVRERIGRWLLPLGVALDLRRNKSNRPLISKNNSRVAVRVIHTDEEIEIARSVFLFLKKV
ncbi:MAG: Acetate kinase [Elusimicrobia bacterium]|nr:Acetate kinase [Elusimicrobiota bacterium]